MAKYLLKTIKMPDDVKHGDDIVESYWMVIDPEKIKVIEIFGKRFVAEENTGEESENS